MKTYIYQVNKQTPLVIDENVKKKINQSESVLIQLFSGEKENKIKELLSYLTTTFSKALIITSSTDGEIANDKVLTYTSVISISIFENTSLKIAYAQNESGFETGKLIAQKLITKDTKLLITFADGLNCNGEEFLDGIYSVNANVIVSGGLSADNSKFKRCLVGINNQLYATGAVAVCLNSKTLHVNRLYNFGWEAIGIEHTITKADGNRIYTIDNMSAVAFYAKYLGEDVAKALPKTGIEFPLIRKENDFLKARAVIQKHADGSLSFAGNIKENENVYLGIGEIDEILSNSFTKPTGGQIESFFIYSCMARRRFLPTLIHKEIQPFAALAPTIGFFTYGEFYTTDSPKLLNQTLTAVALSEKDTQPVIQQRKSITPIPENKRTYKALLHLIKNTSQELQDRTIKLNTLKKEIETKNQTLESIQEISNLASWELDLQTMQIKWSANSYKLYNLQADAEPITYKKFLSMVVPEDREKINIALATVHDGEIVSKEIRVKRNDGKILTLLESAKMIYGGNNKPLKVVGTTMDITELKEKDSILMQQAKHAQMGEMINMIAHQWRQPLNAISAASIKLDMQNQMNLLNPQEITKTAKFIEKMAQNMSQIINDFMSFTKPCNKKEIINFSEIFDDIFSIMGVQLKNHSIEIKLNVEENIQLSTYKKELEHIFINIIANARDAFNDLEQNKKQINIYVSKEDEFYIIKIVDNAGGIPENIIQRVFAPYFTTKVTNKGTGLGLYMCKKILQEHLSGDIFVKNRDDGAEFTILLERDNDK
ncbi:FIST N-terminal domain-containing protein [Sulfurimonas sp.]